VARIRSIKPEYWKSEAIASLSMQTRLTFIALWSYVDDNGVGKDNDRLIAAEIYPLEDDPRATLAHVHRSLDELAHAGRITRYTNDGRSYVHVTNWAEHQKIDRPGKARYPQPDDEGSTLTCTDKPPDAGPDEPSRNPRATLAQPHPPEQGAGSSGTREQGAGEQGANTRSPAADSPALVLVTPDGATVSEFRTVTFDEFWSHYPRKVGKANAKKAWARARKRANESAILQGCIQFANDPNLPETRYVKHPTTWLNGDCWEDDPQPEPAPVTSSAEADRQRRFRHWAENAARIDAAAEQRQIGGTA
jgi:hypothetical protein